MQNGIPRQRALPRRPCFHTNKTVSGGRGRGCDRRACVCLDGLYLAAAFAVKGYRILFFNGKLVNRLCLFSVADRAGVNHRAFLLRGRLNRHVAAAPRVLGFVFGLLAALVCARMPMMSFVIAPFFRIIMFSSLTASGEHYNRQQQRHNCEKRLSFHSLTPF